MNKPLRLLLWVLTIVQFAILSSCTGNSPKIELVKVYQNAVTQFADSLTFEIKYSDADGDLGENEPEVKNLFLKDNRNGIVYGFRIPQLIKKDSKTGIEGRISFTLDQTVLLSDAQFENVSYTIWVKDRAGNQSNQVKTMNIRVSR